jgi:DNA-binding IscR family transcriptional regulator
LARPPADITLEDVYRVIEGPEELVTAVMADLAGRSRTVQVLLDAWKEAARAETAALRAITFADLVERTRVATEPMYYI